MCPDTARMDDLLLPGDGSGNYYNAGREFVNVQLHRRWRTRFLSPLRPIMPVTDASEASILWTTTACEKSRPAALSRLSPATGRRSRPVFGGPALSANISSVWVPRTATFGSLFCFADASGLQDPAHRLEYRVDPWVRDRRVRDLRRRRSLCQRQFHEALRPGLRYRREFIHLG
jgi:hypothetical protein